MKRWNWRWIWGCGQPCGGEGGYKGSIGSISTDARPAVICDDWAGGGLFGHVGFAEKSGACPLAQLMRRAVCLGCCTACTSQRFLRLFWETGVLRACHV